MRIELRTLFLMGVVRSSYSAPTFTGSDVHNDGAKCATVPYQTSLQYGNWLLGFAHVCAGVMINKLWLLTAAHCILEQPPLPFLQFRAITRIKQLNDTGQVSDVRTIIVHPNYKGGANPNDIALLQLKDAIILDEQVNAVRLPNSNVEPVGMATLSRWNRDQDGQVDSLQLPVMGYKECAAALPWLEGDTKVLATSNICTPVLSNGTAACLGDSGGPLIMCDTPEPTLIGILSWGMLPCSSSRGPSVYTRVSAFLDFIYANINN